MRIELERMDISGSPKLLRLAEEIQSSGHGRVLTRDGEPLVTVQLTRRPHRTGQAQPAEPDTLLNILGIGESAEPMDIARYKGEYVAEAAEHPWNETMGIRLSADYDEDPVTPSEARRAVRNSRTFVAAIERGGGRR